MCVQVTLIGRLGNNLFQYALGRIIADNLGLALECRQLGVSTRSIAGQLLDVGSSATLEELADFFPNAGLSIPGQRVEYPVECFELAPGSEWRGQRIDLLSILQDRTPRQIRLRGWFQRFEYYAPYRESIREWFRIRSLSTPYNIAAGDVLVNIRRGADFGMNKWTLPLSYYEDVLCSLPDLGQVYVCGTCIDDSVRSRLAPYRPIYYDASPIEHFRFIMRFNRIVLSNSTFAWWAAFLSDAESIFAPRFTDVHAYAFTGFEDVDLYMQESRYHEVPVRGAVPMGLFVRRNPAATAYFAGGGKLLVVGDRSRGVHTLRVDDANRGLLDCLCRQDKAVPASEVAQFCKGPALQQTVEECVRSGLLVLEPAYLDESAQDP